MALREFAGPKLISDDLLGLLMIILRGPGEGPWISYEVIIESSEKTVTTPKGMLTCFFGIQNDTL